MSAGGVLASIGGVLLVIGILARRAARAARRRDRRMISMRWSEIAAARQREGRIRRSMHAARRGFGHAALPLLFAGLCFLGVGLATLLSGG